MTSLTLFRAPAQRIRNRIGARAVTVVFLEDDNDPEAISIMAEFKTPKGTRLYGHVERLPLRDDWMNRTIQNLLRERERAL